MAALVMRSLSIKRRKNQMTDEELTVLFAEQVGITPAQYDSYYERADQL